MEFLSVTGELLKGFGENCLLFALTLLMAIPLGLLVSMGSMTKIMPIKVVVRAFVWIIRGTPLMLQLFVVFYIPSLLWGISFDRMTAAVIAFVVNYSAYFSEIFRGGIEAIPKGQYEAGQVLGMSKTQIFRKIVLMQVIKRITAPMSNEIITLVKDTSLARVIMVPEMLKAAERFTMQGLIWPLFYTGVFFLIFCGVLTLLFRRLEKKLDYYKI
jgi:polar amino acid transport system permease protein